MAENPDFRLPFNDLTNYVPKNLRNPVISSLIDNLFNRFMTHDESIPLYGYVGRKPASVDDRTPRIPEQTVERDINAIVPVLNFKQGTETVSFTVQDLIRKAQALGIETDGWQWLYSQGNNYLPPINLDKFTNFFNYYWVARAVEAVPDLPWNPELAPEYYTIAAPAPSDLTKLNVVAATVITQPVVLTGTGFEKLKFKLTFTTPTSFSITPIGALSGYVPVATNFALTSTDQHIDYIVSGPGGSVKLLEFSVIRDTIYDANGNPTGTASFEAGDEFLIDVTFLTRNYTVTFSGSYGIKGKITKVKSLNTYQKIDGVQLRAGDRVLIKDTPDAGIYIVSAGTWQRAVDFAGSTLVPNALVFVKNGLVNSNTTWKSIVSGQGIGWTKVANAVESNTNQWQEGNFWVRGDQLADIGIGRSEAIQAVRPIIEYDGAMQLNGHVLDGKPADTGFAYKQYKTEFNQLPLFDLYRYDGTHSGLVSSVFFYEEDLTARLDIALQKRVKKLSNDSSDFVFNHGMVDTDGQLLFVKKNGNLQSIWHAGYVAPHIADVTRHGAGNGTMTGVEAFGFTQQQVWTLTARNSSSFDIVGSKMPVLPDTVNVVHVGTPYVSADLKLTINQGSIPFEAGDVFIVRVGNLESARYVYRDEDGNIFDRYGRETLDLNGEGAWQIPRTFYNNPYNESQSPVSEGVLYSHFRSILANQVEGAADNYAFGGSIKLWSEQQTLLASLLMQRDMTPISMIDLAQRQYETGLNSIRDIFQTRIIQYIADNGPIEDIADVEDLVDWILSIRKNDNDVRTVLFDSTSPVIGFPATLPQLGIADLVKPTIKFDAILGRTLLVHHDNHLSPLFEDNLEFRQSILGNLTTLEILRPNGSYTPAISSFSSTPPTAQFNGELWVTPDGAMRIWNDGAWKLINLADTLNSVMLRVENRLYEGINPNARKYDFGVVDSDAAFNAQLQKELFSFAAVNGYDPLGSDYSPTDAFTWNYSQGIISNFPTLSTTTVPARWHTLLEAHQATVVGVIPTERPNLEPWKLFGYQDGNAWWSSLSTSQRASYTPIVSREAIDNTFIDGGSVRVVETASVNTTLYGLQTIDGRFVSAGDRVLLVNQVSPQNNGVWIAQVDGWNRGNLDYTVKTVVHVTGGHKWNDTVWVVSETAPVGAPIYFKQARTWTTKLWDDVRALHPTLRLSVNEAQDSLLPPYVAASAAWSSNALTNSIPMGVSFGYQFGQASPVETVWRRSLEFGYSQARALFRYDPLAFLGFCWGFNWVDVDGILYDGMDMQMPGHQRFRLHGELVEPIARPALTVTGSGAPIIVRYDAYDTGRRQNFSVWRDGAIIGNARVGLQSQVGGYTFTIRDMGRPFRIGDRFEITNATTTVFVPAATHQIQGFGQTFTHALREVSIDTKTSYAVSAFREWDVNMGYRAGGLVATDDLSVFTDAETLSESAYRLIFKKNQIAHNEWAQALRISVTQFGDVVADQDSGFVPVTNGADWVFRIEGYNPRYLDFSYYTLGGETVTFNALSNANSKLTWLQPTAVTGLVHAHLPITITGIQNVVNFLFGYQRYLESRGWEFNARSEFNIDAETGRVRNFQLEIEKFVDRCYAGISLGQGHVINPFIDRAWFNQKTGLLSEFIDSSLFDVTGHPGVFDTLGVKYKKDDLDVTRTNTQSSFGASGPMFSAHVQVDEFEHLFIFNDYSSPSNQTGVLYDPFSGGRITTYKFNGRKQATNTMRPEFGGHFLVGNEVHQNLQASTDNIANFYDANRAFESETTSRHALALLGFNTKEYFDNLDISAKTQFNFWRGLVQSKGTNMSVDAYLNNNRFDDAKIDEYWAYKVAEYGDARQHSYPELKLAVNDALQQFTQLMFDAKVDEDGELVIPAGYEAFTQISRLDEERWFSLEDLDQDAYFKAAAVGSYIKDEPREGDVYKLPFIADHLSGDEALFKRINATTIVMKQDAETLAISGWGPARPSFNPIKLFNYVDDELVQEIPMWHPAAGVHTPTALESINIISSQNPAKYNYSTLVLNNNSYDPLRPWGAKEVGRVWFNTKNLAYLPYYDDIVFQNLDERLSRWGTLADFATIDVFEWVQSTVPPAEYNVLAKLQAGDADLNSATKAAGEVAQQQTYTRTRNWFMRPIAWSFSPVPVDVDWEALPPFPGGSSDAELLFSDGFATLNKGTFIDYNILPGMRIGAWNNDPVKPKPLSEYLVGDIFRKKFSTTEGDALLPLLVSGPGLIPATVTLESEGYNESLAGQLLFSDVALDVVPVGTDEDGNVLNWVVEASMRVTEVGSGETEYVVVTSVSGEDQDEEFHGAVLGVGNSEKIVVQIPNLGMRITVVVAADGGGEYEPGALRDTIVQALADRVVVRDAVIITPIVPSDIVSMSNDLYDNDYRPGWRAWTVPTQTELDADGIQPNSSWKPYLGDYAVVPGNLAQVQEAVDYAAIPLTLNDGKVIDRFTTSWSNWELLSNTVQQTTAIVRGPLTFTFEKNIEARRASVYLNGIAQLQAAYAIDGKTLVVNDVLAGSEVTVVIRKYEPTTAELNFNPDVADNFAFQAQYKQDYEYVSLPVRDSEGALTSTLYYFWVKNKTTAAPGKKLSVQTITQELRDGPPNYLTFQHFLESEPGLPSRYDAITISGLSYIISKDDTFKLRFTRNFTLRDDPEDLNLKNVHTEWSLMRPQQKTKVPESLWQKLTDSLAGQDAVGNPVPAIRRELYDERNGSRTRFGFGPEQTLAPTDLLRTSIAHTILNTRLTDTTNESAIVPDYITFLDPDESDNWFANAEMARQTMTEIWNSAKVSQVNEIFFAALDDVLANNYELTDIFKTSRLSAYSIKVVKAPPIAQTYE